MNKQNVIDVLKNIVGIILLLYCIRFGSQFLYAPGVIGIKFDYLQDNYPQILVIDENSPLNETDISINDFSSHSWQTIFCHIAMRFAP